MEGQGDIFEVLGPEVHHHVFSVLGHVNLDIFVLGVTTHVVGIGPIREAGTQLQVSKDHGATEGLDLGAKPIRRKPGQNGDGNGDLKKIKMQIKPTFSLFKVVHFLETLRRPH